MKNMWLQLILIVVLLTNGAVAYSQTLDSRSNCLSNRTITSDTANTPNFHSRSRDLSVLRSLPESHIPLRSPGLGSPTFPLSPSIGPGSGLLGLDAGLGPLRLWSGAESGSKGRSSDRTPR
jgi:hypothetical protein